MSFLNDSQIGNIKEKLVDDEKELKQLYKEKKQEYHTLSVKPSLVADYEKNGWEIYQPLKTKTKIRKEKSHSEKFEDDVWCQFYELGYRTLNRDETFELPFGKDVKDKKQIDVIAINKETVFLIECKSSKKSKKAPSYKDEFDLLKLRLNGFRKAIAQLFGKDIKIKHIFATRNLRLESDSDDMKRLEETSSFYYNDNTYDYLNSLIKNYKAAAHYQFLGLIFKNEKINNNKIEIPALEGKMGNKKYYMFSIEPSLLLKIGFILHRTKANDGEAPTYQRLLVPSRLKGITKFIDEGGYFPNSLIVNFSSNKRIQFESSSRSTGSSSRFGTLKIPNEYAIAYIIDGQHRLYGYANSKYIDSNTIPVVALSQLDSTEQLDIFMNINQNQKAVSTSLRGALEEDLHWNSERTASRLKALRSAITTQLGVKPSSPLYNKVSIGEDPGELKFQPFLDALLKSGLLPTATGNKYNEKSTLTALYDVNNTKHQEEMEKTKKRVVDLLSKCYEYVESNYPAVYEEDRNFIIYNRGTYPFIVLIGSLHSHLVEKGELDKSSTSQQRFSELEKYLIVLLNYIKNMPTDEQEYYFSMLGAGAATKWLRFFQSVINDTFKDYEPEDLIDWKERQDVELQDEGRKYGIEIEKRMKYLVLDKIKKLYGGNWELEINSIKRKCQERAEEEKEKHYKEGLVVKDTHWTEMFNISDYKTIIEKYWVKNPEVKSDTFITFEEDFSINIGGDFNSKKDKTKWISNFSSYRNLWAHEGTKEKTLNRQEVEFLEKVYKHFYDK